MYHDHPIFARHPEIVCRTTTRIPPAPAADGPFNMGVHIGPGKDFAADRRRRVCADLGVDFAGLTVAEQVHGCRVEPVDAARRGSGRDRRGTSIAGADGLITDLPDTPLMALSADCCPLALYDPRRKAVAAVHAGRKSTAAGIAGKTVAALADVYGSRPEDLIASVGPSIGPCCYRVGPEIRAEFPDSDALFQERDGGLYLDLWTANLRQLLAAGLNPADIAVSGVCTACRTDIFFSYRREGSGCGLLGTIISRRG